MSHNFLFDTYDYIAGRLAAVEQALTRPRADDQARQYAAGQVEVLCDFERFLKGHFDIKLPGRLRNRQSRASALCRQMACKD